MRVIVLELPDGYKHWQIRNHRNILQNALDLQHEIELIGNTLVFKLGNDECLDSCLWIYSWAKAGSYSVLSDEEVEDNITPNNL